MLAHASASVHAPVNWVGAATRMYNAGVEELWRAKAVWTPNLGKILSLMSQAMVTIGMAFV